MRDSLGRSLNGELDDLSWRQAVDGFKEGTEPLERAVSSLPDDLTLNFRGTIDNGGFCCQCPVESADEGRGRHTGCARETGLDVLLEEAFLADDGEPGADLSGHVAGPLQRGLCGGRGQGRVWDEVLRSQRRWADVRRLRELRNVADQNRSSKTGLNLVWPLTITLLLWVLRS